MGITSSRTMIQNTHPKKADQWFSDNNITPLKWPAQSPDLNHIEHLQQHLKTKLQQYDTPPKGVHDLWDRMAKELNDMPPETCQTLIESMPRRIQAVLKAKGSYKVLDHKIIEGQKTAPMFDYFVWFIKKWILIRVTLNL